MTYADTTNVSVRPNPASRISPNRAARQIHNLPTGMLQCGHWRPHPIGQKRKVGGARHRTSQRLLNSKTCRWGNSHNSAITDCRAGGDQRPLYTKLRTRPDLKGPEQSAASLPRSTGKKHQKQNGADQTCAISLPEIRLEKGFSTASTSASIVSCPNNSV